MTALAALLFDFDGTIAETERDGHRVAYNAAFEDARSVWHWDVPTYGEYLTTAGGKERLDRFIRADRPDIEAEHRAELVASLHESKRGHFDRIADSLPLRPGIARLVAEARAAGLRCAIATTAAPSGVDAILRRDRAFADAFEFIAAGDIVPHKKPAPDIYTYALGRLGLPADACLAFEDSSVGLRSALAAGIATVVTPSSYNAHDRFDGAAAIFDSLGEPDRPLATIAGPPPAEGFIDVAYLRRLHNATRAGSSLRSR
ncbi:MAG: HAD family hydrolase [Vulcanimicrobiaceae bacterium]